VVAVLLCWIFRPQAPIHLLFDTQDAWRPSKHRAVVAQPPPPATGVQGWRL